MSDISLVQEWLEHSHNDLISAKHLFNNLYPKQIEIASYLSQQCAETALKGFLVYNNYEPPKIHDLDVLCKLCKKYDTTFETIRNYCADLTDYGVITRYPNELEIDEASAKLAIEKAEKIYKFCLARIPEEGRPTKGLPTS